MEPEHAPVNGRERPQEATAKAEKETAAQKQAEAAEHKTKAQQRATEAKDAKERAETADTTATEKRKGAEAARDKAKALRDDAWDAEQKAIPPPSTRRTARCSPSWAGSPTRTGNRTADFGAGPRAWKNRRLLCVRPERAPATGGDDARPDPHDPDSETPSFRR